MKTVVMNNSMIHICDFYFQHLSAMSKKPASKSCMHCTKGDFPRAQYTLPTHCVPWNSQ